MAKAHHAYARAVRVDPEHVEAKFRLFDAVDAMGGAAGVDPAAVLRDFFVQEASAT